MDQYNNTDSQGELFNEICHENMAHSERLDGSYKSQKRFRLTFETVLLFSIFLIITGAISFIYGYRQGLEKSPLKKELVTTDKYIVIEDEAERPVNLALDEKGEIPIVEPLPESAVPVVESIVSSGTENIPVESESVRASADATVAIPDTQALMPDQNKTWTIQLVTYASEEYAVKEVTQLKKDGFDAFIIPSGKYQQVCSNYFETEGDAAQMLKKFKSGSRYRDAYVRKVIR
jgi:hypothetical protein